MKNNKKQGRCPFSPLTLLAALLLIGGMLAIILPVLQWDAEVSAEAGEYEQLREQNRQAEARETVEEETLNQHVVPPLHWRKKDCPFSSPKTQSANGRRSPRWTCPHIWRKIPEKSLHMHRFFQMYGDLTLIMTIRFFVSTWPISAGS